MSSTPERFSFKDDRICFRWREGTRHWQIFGLFFDGGFYGEYIDYGNRRGFKNLEGTVSPEDCQLIMSLAQKIKVLPRFVRIDAREDFIGVLIEGTRGTGNLLFTGFEGLPAPAHDALFAEMVGVMRNCCAPQLEGW